MLLKPLLKTFTTAFFLISILSTASAQETTSPLFGIYGGVNTNQVPVIYLTIAQDAAMLRFNPYSNQEIGFFKSFSPSLGMFVNYPLSASIILSGRLGYTYVGAETEFSGYSFNKDTSFNSELTFKSHNIELSPVVLFNDIFLSNLYLLAGGEVGFPVSTSYSLTEHVKAPNFDTTSMYAIDESLKTSPMRLALVGGIGYNFTIGKIAILSPEITYRAPLSDFQISNNVNTVRINQLRFTLNISFLPENSQPLPERDLQVFIDTVGTYQSDGNFTLLKALKVEDVQYSELYPLVPYAFYLKNSGVPAAEYDLLKPDERGAAAVVLKPDALEINRQLLNVIGSRMKTEFPQSALKITGTTDGKVETKVVAQQRADFAKNYLLKTFAIGSERITTDARALPLKPSVQTLAEGDAENRRVEFSSATPELLAPISMAGENERLAYPELVEFRPYAVSGDSITEWTLTLAQSGKTIREYKGTGIPKPQRWMIRPNELAGTQIPVDYTFSAGTSGKVFKTASGSLPIDYISSNRKKAEKLADKTVSKYSLILFDFDKAELTPENQFVVESTILPALKYNSTVKIYGYTDKIGDEKHNMALSLQRAQIVQSVLKAKVASAKYEVIGSGETTELFDNNSPIGRHLSRTVVIVVETPR